MIWQTRCLIWLIAILLFAAIFLPSPVQAQYFGLAPAEIELDDLSPGGEAEFNLTIHNKDDINHTFMLTTYNPEEAQLKLGRTEFPDDSWISFSSQQVEVVANSEAEVKVTVGIPLDQKWAGKDWEVWLGVSPESSDLLTVKLYARLLVSTSEKVESGPNIALIVAIAVAMLLLGYGIYYFRRKSR